MPGRSRSPLEGVERLVVDGTNLLHRLAGESGQAAPPVALIGRIRAAIPAAVSIDLVFDGMGDGPRGRLAQSMHVRYSGRRSADDTILDLAGGRAADATSHAWPGVLVVTDDRELRHRVQERGARSVPLAWLVARLDIPRLAAPAPGNPRPPVGFEQPGGPGLATESTERPPWRPGRGATTKRGPARRLPRHRRRRRHPPG